MATYVENLLIIRDSLAQELATETAHRALHGPKASYSVSAGGRSRSVSWNEYLATMTEQIRAMNEAVQMAGGDGGLIEERIRAYS